MERREVLLSGGTIITSVLAGCSSNQDEELDRSNNTTNGTDSNANVRNERDIEIYPFDSELVVEEDTYALAHITNDGSDRSGPIDITIQWFDEEQRFIGNDSQRLYTLGGGESWTAQVYANSVNSDWISDFEILIDYTPTLPTPPQNIQISDTELNTNDSPVISGIVENSNPDMVDSLTVIGKVYEGTDWVLYDNALVQQKIPANTDWRFELSLPPITRDVGISGFDVFLSQ